MQTKYEKQDGLKRVVVIGASCVGKTTFAKRLAEVLDAKHIEMDSINWLPEWEQRTTEELRELTEKETCADKWVLDGNYSRAKDIFWARATHVIWLNYSFPTVVYRAITRTSRRAFTGEDICGGNHESFRQSFLSTDSMILWAIKTYHSRRRRYRKEVEKTEFPNANFIVFKNSREADDFIDRGDSLTP